MKTSEQEIATLVYPDDYQRQLNNIARVTTQHVVYLRRVFMSGGGFDMVHIPLAEFQSVEYRQEFSIARVVFGAFLVALIALIGVAVHEYWNDLEPETKVPIGALGIAGIYGVILLFGAKRHRFVFVQTDGAKLQWKSRAGDFKIMQPMVDRLIKFTRSSGLMH